MTPKATRTNTMFPKIEKSVHHFEVLHTGGKNKLNLL